MKDLLFLLRRKQILRVAQDDMCTVHGPWAVAAAPIQATRNDGKKKGEPITGSPFSHFTAKLQRPSSPVVPGNLD